MTRRLKFPLALVLIFASFTAAYSQAQKGPTHLVLAVTFRYGHNPSLQPVPWSDPKGQGSWYGGFAPIDSFHPATGVPPVRAVRIVPQVEGDAVRVKVLVMYGQRLMDRELPIANYLLRVDDTVRVEKLKDYGIQPFELRLVKMFASPENFPSFVTNAASISALNAQPNDTTLPSVTVKLTNLSYKEVIAMGVNLLVGERVEWTTIPRGAEGRNLIEAGGTYDLFVATAERTQAGPKVNAPVFPPDQKLLITAVLFRDGTFEGDSEVAARAAAYYLGEKIMLVKLLPLFDQALAAGDSNPAAVLEQLRSKVSEQTYDVDPKVAEELAGKFPALAPQTASRLKIAIDVASLRVKTDLLKRLDSDKSFDHAQTSTELFHTHLTRIRDGIKEWHDRL